MMHFRQRAHQLLILLILSLAGSVFAVEHLDIHSTADTSYLLMRYVELYAIDRAGSRKPILHGTHIFDDHSDSLGQRRVVILRNRGLGTDDPAIITQQQFPNGRVIEDDAVRLILTDSWPYDDPGSNLRTLILIGYAGDSAWIVKYAPGSGPISKKLLTTGADGTGDGIWDPNIGICLVEDYDYDGCLEAFIYLTSRREDGPRTLFCIQLDTFDEEWRLPVASEILHHGLFSCRDSLDPRVIFATGNHMQGRLDNNYDDRFAFVSIVDSHGALRYNRVTSVTASSKFIIPSGQPGQFLLPHHTALLTLDSVVALDKNGRLSSLADGPYCISRIDSDGRILDGIVLDYRPQRGWMETLAPDHQPTLFICNAEGVVRAYDTGLNLIAESHPAKIGSYIGRIKLAERDTALVFSDGIYTHDLQKLVHFPKRYAYYQSLAMHEDSTVTSILLSNGSGFSIGRLETRSIVDLASVFYHRHQSYVLMILSGLVVGLIVVNFYRRRAHQTADVIARQKEQLEKTHAALKEAQAKVIEQEKYRQARDIAGGFSHEIRNALFPAVGLLAKLKTMKLDSESNIERAGNLQRDAARAVSRAVSITELISQYTRLGSQHLPEKVNLTDVLEDVIDANRYRIDHQSVPIQITGMSDLTVRSNAKQLAIVFNNLLLNSLDALDETPHPAISVTAENKGNHVRLRFSDNGCGIPKENHARIFDTFFSTKPDRGMGIGLSTVRKIIEMYDGRISAHDNPDGGTTFEILLRPYQK